MMSPAITLANVALGLGWIALAVVGVWWGGTAAQGDAGLALIAGLLQFALGYGVATRRTLLVWIIAFPQLAILVCLGALLLFAPLAWGRSNELAAYLLQGLALLAAMLQVASILAVRASRREP